VLCWQGESPCPDNTIEGNVMRGVSRALRL